MNLMLFAQLLAMPVVWFVVVAKRKQITDQKDREERKQSEQEDREERKRNAEAIAYLLSQQQEKKASSDE